ncbi:hypothetical protein D3C77_681250 [compost metagenome]
MHFSRQLLWTIHPSKGFEYENHTVYKRKYAGYPSNDREQHTDLTQAENTGLGNIIHRGKEHFLTQKTVKWWQSRHR